MPWERDRYPEDWAELSLKKKQEANWCCQHCGRVCKRNDEDWADFFKRGGAMGGKDPKPGRYILTVAHLDQDPQNGQDENLAALCTVCHLRYDRRFFLSNRYAKRERSGQLNLFGPIPLREWELGGHGKEPTRLQPPLVTSLVK